MSLGRTFPISRRLAVAAALCALALGASVKAAQWVADPSQLQVDYSTTDPSATEPTSATTESLAAQAAAGDQAADSPARESTPAAVVESPKSPAGKSASLAAKANAKSVGKDMGKAMGQSTLVEPALQPNPMASNGPNSHSAVSALLEPKASPGKLNTSSLADAMDAPTTAPEAAPAVNPTEKPMVDDMARAKDAAASVGDTKPLSTGVREPVAYLSPSDQYLVQPGDILQITVWKEEDLQREVLVRPDGGLSFPLAGDIAAAGRTVEQIQKDLSTRIENYIPEPVVTVAVKQVVGNRVYVVGRVNKPGEIIMGHELTVMQALSLAGGVTPFASLNSVHVLRRENGVERSIPFRYGDVEKGRSLSQNILLQNGDVVVVP